MCPHFAEETQHRVTLKDFFYTSTEFPAKTVETQQLGPLSWGKTWGSVWGSAVDLQKRRDEFALQSELALVALLERTDLKTSLERNYSRLPVLGPED
eukprot:5504546-Amphidinium_carterae.2